MSHQPEKVSALTLVQMFPQLQHALLILGSRICIIRSRLLKAYIALTGELSIRIVFGFEPCQLGIGILCNL